MVRPFAMRSFVHARAIWTAFATILAIVAPARVAHADEPAPSTSTQANAASDEERLRKLKSEGDRALAEGRLSDAIKAYHAARDIRRDPLTAGRMGLAISYFDDPRAFEAAAMMLYEAVRDAAGVSTQEKDAFFAAYKRMRKLVCKIEITTNDTNAQIDFGQGFKPRIPAFFVFVQKGKGEAVASLEGRADIHKTWDCAGNHDIDLKFDFPPVVAEPAKTITVIVPGKETVKIVHEPIPVERPIAKPESSARNRFTVAAGPVMVFGASPAPSFGMSIASNYAFGHVSAMIAARGAWSSASIGKMHVDSFVLMAMGGPCAQWKWFDGCIAVTIASLQHRAGENQLYKPGNGSLLIPGLGLGLGVRSQLSKTFALRLGGDFALLTKDISFSRQHEDQVDLPWNGGNILFGLSAMAILGH